MPITHYDTSSLTLYVRFSDGDDTCAPLTAGTNPRRYLAADAALVTASLDAGMYDAIICAGDYSDPQDTDAIQGHISRFVWSGTVEVVEDAAIKAKTDNLPSDPADASVIAASFSTTDGTLSTIGGDVTSILGKWTGITSFPNWLRAICRKGNIDSTTITEINATTGSGTGTYAPSTDALEALRDQGDAEWGNGVIATLQLDQRPIASEFTATLPKRSAGLVALTSPLRLKTNEAVIVAVDFAAIMAEGDWLTSLDSAETTNLEALTLEIIGVDRTLAKIKISEGVVDTTYTINLLVTTQFTDSLDGQFYVAYPDSGA